jgi:site-specific recombinase XerD
MLNRGALMVEINGLLGHEKLSTTAQYARLAPERLRLVFETTHPDNRATGL